MQQYVSLIVRGIKGVIPEEEFIGYFPAEMSAFIDIFQKKNSLLGAWNRYSRQKADYECVIKAICDNEDIPDDYLMTDPDIVRLRFLQYMQHNYSNEECNLAREIIKARLEIYGEYEVLPLLDDEQIEKQIEIKNNYVKERLDRAYQVYIDNLSEMR